MVPRSPRPHGTAFPPVALRLTEFLPANASPGFSFPLRDISGRSPLTPGFPNSRYVPPSGFLNLSAGYSSSNPAALFHAAATSRVPPSRGFPSRVAGSPHRIALPSWRWLSFHSPSPSPEPVSGAFARLQGFHPPAESVFPATMVRPSQGLVPLMGFLSSPGFSLLLSWSRSPDSSARALGGRAALPERRHPIHWTPAYYRPGGAAGLFRELPTRLRFLAVKAGNVLAALLWRAVRSD
jgi:hypothetical protein